VDDDYEDGDSGGDDVDSDSCGDVGIGDYGGSGGMMVMTFVVVVMLVIMVVMLL
jgi:hypothetical protein